MSIKDHVQSSNSGLKDKETGESWASIFNRKEQDNKYLKALREGTETEYDLEIDGEVCLKMRVLTCHEEVLLSHWVHDYLSKYSNSALPQDKQRENENIISSMLRIMMACTPSSVVGMSSKLKTYNDNSSLPIANICELATQELSWLIKEYQYVDQRFNPQIETLPSSEAWEIIDQIKKHAMELKDLSYPSLLTITTALIEHNKLEDEMLSTASQEQQS
jgi:hypothetical protein